MYFIRRYIDSKCQVSNGKQHNDLILAKHKAGIIKIDFVTVANIELKGYKLCLRLKQFWIIFLESNEICNEKDILKLTEILLPKITKYVMVVTVLQYMISDDSKNSPLDFKWF